MALLPVNRLPEQSPDAGLDPANEVKLLRRELTRRVDSSPGFTTCFGDAFAPTAKIAALDDAYIVEQQLPGAERSAIEVTIGGRKLSVTGSRASTRRRRFRRARLRRRADRQHFSDEVVFPGDIDENEVGASLDDDTLTVRAPKPRGEPRRIDIQ